MTIDEAYTKLIDSLNATIEPITDQPNKYASLMEKIGDARFVLIGEASHGTHEFYQARIEITQQLIQHKDFQAIAIEGDWPDVYGIHRYLQGQGNVDDEKQALNNFNRFPIWMWRNITLPPFLKWLRNFNDRLPAKEKIGMYGLDLYSLYTSIKAVIDYLEKVDPAEAKRAKLRYACFDHLCVDPQDYGYLINTGLKKACVKEAIEQLLELQNHALDYLSRDDLTAADEYFYATQNAHVIKDAEKYYRSLFEGRVSCWNLRDTHMAETFTLLADHLENRSGKPAKIIVWAHNSHVGDARATEMGEKGEINIGQLIREQHDVDTYLIGFSTYDGFVTAASDWGNPAEHKPVNPGMPSSYEELFHNLKYKNFLLPLTGNKNIEHLLSISRLQRAIGVIYRPETEYLSHYFYSRLPYQFDSIIHFDHTTAVQPLDINPEWHDK